MNMRKNRLFACCESACKTGERVEIDSPKSAFRLIRSEVLEFNRLNPHWECYLLNGPDGLVIVPVDTSIDVAPINDLRAIISGKTDVEIVSDLYDLAMKKDAAIVNIKRTRKWITDIMAELNEMGRGDVRLRYYGGKLYFYRRFWLKGREFGSAIRKWYSYN